MLYFAIAAQKWIFKIEVVRQYQGPAKIILQCSEGALVFLGQLVGR